MKRKYNTICFESTDSTNDEAKRRLKSDNLSVITAHEQTAGRGQRGNTWHSTPGLNLTFSMLVRWGRDGIPAMPAADQFTVSRIVTVALTDLLASKNIRATIKWPNDIYAGDKKICGILIEHTVNGPWLSSSVIGIGLNINEKDFPADIPNPTSVINECGVRYETGKLLNEYIDLFDSYLDIAGTEEGRQTLEEAYLKTMYRKDETHRYIDLRHTGAKDTGSAASERDGMEFTGIIRGVAPNACLLVENEKGGLEEFAFKEIAYII